MADNKFDTTVSSLFKGMDGFLSAKTVVGEPVTCLLYTSPSPRDA